MKNTPLRPAAAAIAIAALVGGLSLTATGASAAPATTRTAPTSPAKLTNLAHLDFLLDTTSPAAVAGHTTYRLADEPSLTVPWTYANANGGGGFTRVGGGDLDAATGDYTQGAFNADDIARTAVVYLRDWKQNGTASSKTKAYELLRSVAYLQTSSGANAGNVVLWMQSDGTLNPSAKPVELPDPSDSGASYWLARSLWAFGEGYADFKKSDPAFASFLKQRIGLGIDALNREALNKYGKFALADGKRVPAWLIINGADASAEAVIGLAAYAKANSHDSSARTALRKLARGIALMGAGDRDSWPYGAILPWGESRSMWHAYASQMPAALAVAASALGDRSQLKPALADSATFDPTLLTAGGPDNAWYPTPVDTTQIAYGVDSRLQSLLAVASVSHSAGLKQLAGIEASWYFGTNKSGQPVYDPATGVTFDGVQPDGTVNHNSGAESTIHGLLSMLALDAHPDVAKLAQSTPVVASRDGLKTVEAETASTSTGTVVTPASAWTGESQYSGGKYLQLAQGQSATISLGASTQARTVEPVIYEPSDTAVKSASVRSVWKSGSVGLGSVRSGVGPKGITEADGALLPQSLDGRVPAGATTVTVTAPKGTLLLDALIVRPVVSSLVFTGPSARTELVHSLAGRPVTTSVGVAGSSSRVRVYDAKARAVAVLHVAGKRTVRLPAGGFAVVTAAG